MKKAVSIIFISLVLIYSMVIGGSAAVTKQTDVTKASSGCVLTGLQGKYIAECKQALTRMNEIRLEACREHVKNPETGKALTLSDYIPLKWSSDMEYIARIRAAESSITLGHVRTNGKPWYDIYSSGKKYAECEVIAWNYTASMTSGIEQWYAEKNAWVKNTGGVTGHYEAMINPEYRYVGLGTFYCKNVEYYNTTVGEFSSSKDLWSTTQGTGINDVIQILNVKSSYYNKYKKSFVVINSTVTTAANTAVKTASAVADPKKTSSISVNTKSVTLKKGKKFTLKTKVCPSTSKQKVTFKSSKKKVVTVSKKGVLKGNKVGKANITITSGKVKVVVRVVVK